ncbi:gibberellin receptor gid1b [Phtheirospermum japonicum]|uniref:Gibberellin receptor gid1b n=1 Tax=Phtheirospermum japonicum TaxID=374723 RepID=A0A830B9V5_9LAMI|nr:gibberellin receptor gid1b [Phtheirospermum japonicum]
MAGSNEVNVSESKRVVPLHTWILISKFKLAYNILRRADGTFNRDLNEFLDQKVPSNSIPSRRGLLTSPSAPPRSSPSSSSSTGAASSIHPPTAPSTTRFCRRLVGSCKAAVVSVDYRRSPEHRYPSAYDDGWAALKWVGSRPWLKSGNTNNSKVHIYLAGDSSGGNIAHHVAVRAAMENVEVLGNILLHPLFGGEERTESERRLDGKFFVRIQDRDWYWRAYLPEGEDRDHPACNVFGPRSLSLECLKFPKSLVVVAGLDILQDWQIGYVEGLRKYGQEVKLLFLEKATIGFYFMPNNDHFHTLMDEVKSFIEPDC